MGNDTRAIEVMRIVEGLATLPGGKRVDVSFKRFARAGPAEAPRHYESSTRSFGVEQMPGALPVPDDADEIVVRLRGALRGTLHRDLLVAELETLLERSRLKESWDVRVNFRQNEDRLPQYELTAYPHLFNAAEAWGSD